MKRLIAVLTPVHRYLGLVFCLIFVAWFASGLVMIYARMPAYTGSERVARLKPLDPAAVRLSPAEAVARADIGSSRPGRITLTTYRSRPVYRFRIGPDAVTVFADDGSVLEPVKADEALAIVRDAFPDHAGSARVRDTLTRPDQWTIEAPFGSTGPLHVIALGDPAATDLYVASNTGGIVLETDRASRFWGYAGPVMHWFYFRPLRVNGPLWANVIIYGSLAGCVLCLLGLTVGIYRYSLARYRQGISATPYSGWLRWHHYAGLIFGVITLTWVFSGMLSMEPWGLSYANDPGVDQVVAIRGDGVDAARFVVSPARALDALRTWGPAASSDVARVAKSGAGPSVPKELDLIQFMGAPFYRAEDPLRGTVLVTADHGPAIQAGFTQPELLAAARAAMPGKQPGEITWLTGYDGYYYDRSGGRPLPVLRVKYGDESASWLYLDAHDGGLVQRETSRSRLFRWLYYGLHDLDLPRLYQAGWIWYAVIVGLCGGGLLLSMTSVIVGWRWLRR